MKSDESEAVDSKFNPVHSENKTEIDFKLQSLFLSVLAEIYHSGGRSGNPELFNSSEDWRLFDKLMKKLMTHIKDKRGEPFYLSHDEESFLLKAIINSVILKNDDEIDTEGRPLNRFRRRALIDWLRSHKDKAVSTETIDELVKGFQDVQIIPLRIAEEPITPQTLAITFTALTELTTKLWLIAKHRFADLTEYTQTHDIRFANEAGATIVWATYNSPFSVGLTLDKVVPGIAEACITILDGVKQRDARQQKAELENIGKELENQAKAQQIELDKQKAELENQAKAQQIELGKQKAEHDQKMADLETKIKELELQERQAELMFKIEERRVDLLERALELFNKKREIGIEIAGNAVNILLPDGDASTKLMLGQSLLPNILQIQDVTGLELILPKPKVDEENPEENAGK